MTPSPHAVRLGRLTNLVQWGLGGNYPSYSGGGVATIPHTVGVGWQLSLIQWGWGGK